MRRSNFHTLALLAILTLTGVPTWANPPVLNSLPAYESPVQGDPDGLLLLSGNGLAAADTVVYRRFSTPLPPPHPAVPPASSSGLLGVADLASSADAPYSLSIHLPNFLTQGAKYILWVMAPDGTWSNGVTINDARPLWITPDSAYQTASLANLPRVLKVVGRNLEPTSSWAQVRLVGQNTGTAYTLYAHNSASNPADTTAVSERYIAEVDLPTSMVVDQYWVQVTRDGNSWVGLLGNGQSPAQVFTVNPDPVPPATSVSVSDFAGPVSGPCQPDDGIDDTACIVLAMRAVQAAGGGTVNFGPGTWLVSKTGNYASGAIFSDIAGNTPSTCTTLLQTCGVSWYGLLVPPGVNLQGAGATGTSVTTIERGVPNTVTPSAGWPIAMPLLTVQGNNTISGFNFVDDNVYTVGSGGGPVIQLGFVYWFARLYSATDPVTVSNVVISNNLFNKPFFAIYSRGLPIDHLYITYNTFGGAWSYAILVAEDESNVQYLVTPNQTYPYLPFTFSHTIINYNTFYPSSFQQTAATYNGGGPIATNIGTGLYSDLSSNVADGTSTQYLYNAGDPRGWRAAFFLSSGAGQDMTLVSNNTISCSGDKYGDGEAIVYDGSYSSAQMGTAQPAITATAWTDPQGIAGTALTVQGTVHTMVGSVDISSNPGPFYQGSWVQIVGGAGKGQWRKLETLSLGSNSAGSTVTLYVTPAFSVPPDATSLVDINRAYWQNTTVNNYIDQRTPLCTKANGRQSGGVISWYDSTADSVIAGNQQYDTSGIMLNHSYHPLLPGAAWITAGAVVESANEVRDNTINGSYAWSSTGEVAGGILLGFGAADGAAPSPPLLGYGETIAGNTLYQASGRDRDGTHVPIGAIATGADWSVGPLDTSNVTAWQMGDTALIFNNTLQNISNTIAGSAPGLPLPGIGLDTPQGNAPINWRTTLYGNTCSVVDTPLADFGTSTVRYCPKGSATGTCECNGVSTTDVGVAAVSSVSSASVNSGVTYTVTVTNNGPAIATAVTLSLEASAGLQVGTTAFATGPGSSCDGSTRVCNLGSLASGQSATVTVNATLTATGAWPATFSVTHHEADPAPTNDSVTTTVTAM